MTLIGPFVIYPYYWEAIVCCMIEHFQNISHTFDFLHAPGTSPSQIHDEPAKYGLTEVPSLSPSQSKQFWTEHRDLAMKGTSPPGCLQLSRTLANLAISKQTFSW